ncbi:MAG: hypothetical protein ACREN7_08735 [Candidatus Dormibacteria bacterium]
MRPLLVPLIGEAAYRRCVRANRCLGLLIPCLIVGLAAVLVAAFSPSAARPGLLVLWALCCLYALVAIVVLWGCARGADALASQAASLRLGRQLVVRGGRARLDVATWKRRIDQALERNRGRLQDWS